MLLAGYQKEFVNPPNPHASHLRCVAHLNEDIGSVLPYLHTVLKGHQFFPETPSLTLQYQGKMISLYPRQICINIVRDAEEADAVLQWLQREINTAWENKAHIQPSYGVLPKPKLFNILKLLPKTNCRQCGQATCMVFASRIVEGFNQPEDCPPLTPGNKKLLQDYLSQF